MRPLGLEPSGQIEKEHGEANGDELQHNAPAHESLRGIGTTPSNHVPQSEQEDDGHRGDGDGDGGGNQGRHIDAVSDLRDGLRQPSVSKVHAKDRKGRNCACKSKREHMPDVVSGNAASNLVCREDDRRLIIIVVVIRHRCAKVKLKSFCRANATV